MSGSSLKNDITKVMYGFPLICFLRSIVVPDEQTTINYLFLQTCFVSFYVFWGLMSLITLYHYSVRPFTKCGVIWTAIQLDYLLHIVCAFLVFFILNMFIQCLRTIYGYFIFATFLVARVGV